MQLVLLGLVARLGTVRSRRDLDAVGYPAHALDSSGNFLSDLLEILGGNAALQLQSVAAYRASDVAKREVAATSNQDLGLAADHWLVGTT
jgi:hypothetical protein